MSDRLSITIRYKDTPESFFVYSSPEGAVVEKLIAVELVLYYLFSREIGLLQMNHKVKGTYSPTEPTDMPGICIKVSSEGDINFAIVGSEIANILSLLELAKLKFEMLVEEELL